MKFLVIILMLLYIVSPIDVMPAVPVDDIVVTVGGAAYLLAPKDWFLYQFLGIIYQSLYN